MENIKIAFDSKTNLYLIKLPSVYQIEFEINGKLATDPMNGSLNCKEFYTSEKPTKIVGKKQISKISHYENNQDASDTLSVEEYTKRRQSILSTVSYYEDDDEDYPVWKNPKFEADWIIFNKTYKPVYKTEIEKIEYEIEIIEYPVSEYPEIVPMYSIDAKSIYSTKCKVNISTVVMLRTILESYGLTESGENTKDNNYHIPTHGGIRFVKINGSYITGAEQAENMYSRTKIDTYENCVEYLNKVKTGLKEIVELHFAKNSNKTLSKDSIGVVITTLTKIQNRVNGLDVKQKNYRTQLEISKYINDQIKEFTKLAEIKK
jgi:hypothetical protein